MEEVTAEKGSEGRVMACQLEAWGKAAKAEKTG